MHVAILVLKGDEPLCREVHLVERVVHGAAMTQRPEGFPALVDTSPRGVGPRAQSDETTDDEAPALPGALRAALTRARAAA